jgi:hypothetical protein
MFGTLAAALRRLFRTEKPAPRPPRPPRPPRLGVEFLEDRAVPADIALLAARLDTPTVVGVGYNATDGPVTVELGVYRSADRVLDAGDVFLGETTVTADGRGRATIDLGAEMPIDATRNLVLVVADADNAVGETNEGNNVTSFRRLTLGAIAHGYTLTGDPPEWLNPAARALRSSGYEAVIRFVWTPLSQSPTPGGQALAGQILAARARVAAFTMATRPTDVIDLHMIGHSRGAGVVSRAFRYLEFNPGPRALRLAFFQETFLDPHVARNFAPLSVGLAELAAGTGMSTVGDFSYNPASPDARLFAAGTLSFQAGANDRPAFVAANVDRAEMFFQRIPWDATLPGSVERVIGVNFLSPLPEDVRNFSDSEIIAEDLGPLGIGHYEVPLWYLENVLR